MCSFLKHKTKKLSILQELLVLIPNITTECSLQTILSFLRLMNIYEYKIKCHYCHVCFFWQPKHNSPEPINYLALIACVTTNFVISCETQLNIQA